MSDKTVDRLFVDDAMGSLAAAEAHVLSLMADMKVRDEMISQLLTTVASQNAQLERLMWRLRRVQEPARG